MRIIIRLSAVLLVLILAACNDPLDHPAYPVALPLSDHLNEVIQFAVAIDPQGVKHIASIECPVGTMEDCILVYQTYPGGIHNTYTPAAGYSYAAPDIAVDPSGQAYIVVNKVTDSPPVTATTSWVKPGVNSLNFIDPSYITHGIPHVAANGYYVYVVWEVVNDQGSALRYRQLNILDDTAGWASDFPASDTVHRSSFDIAVSSAGKLFVTWRTWPTESTQSIHFTSNIDTDTDMIGQLQTIQTASGLGKPHIAVDPTNTHVYVAYSKNPGIVKDEKITGDNIRLWVCTVNCLSGSTITSLLDTTYNPWWLSSEPSLTAAKTGDLVYVVFSATNNAVTAGEEVFQVDYRFSTGIYATYRATNDNSDDDVAPQVVSLTDSAHANNFFVLGWRKKINTTTYGDVYTYSIAEYFKGAPGKVAESNSGAEGMDMAASDHYLVGGWIADINPYLQSSHTVWISFNDCGIYLPFIRR